jgi:hypothetical protein
MLILFHSLPELADIVTTISSTFTPLIFSAIFYASNGQNHISYIDALFNSVSAMTVCGLASVDLSSLTAWQQVILFIQMCLGSPVSDGLATGVAARSQPGSYSGFGSLDHSLRPKVTLDPGRNRFTLAAADELCCI